MIATVTLAAHLKLPIDVIATVPIAENMPSATAQRPGDVLTQYGGTTVEVLNTDAEGRLILADAIVRACEDNPDYLIETSTLTGAQTVALGARIPGVMGSDEFRDRVAAISQRVGESGWPMPLPDELKEDLKSTVADLANVSGQRFAGMLVAGVFLREFVADSVDWAHIDVAAPPTTPAARGAIRPRVPPACRPGPWSRSSRTSAKTARKPPAGYLVTSEITARLSLRRGQPVRPAAASAARAAFRPQAPCTEPPGVADALPKYSPSIGVSARPSPGAGRNISICGNCAVPPLSAPRCRLASLASRSDGRCTNRSSTRAPNPGACASMTWSIDVASCSAEPSSATFRGRCV
ncbi:cytosol aminopeptidase family, catalytic domain protein [Mycobacterium kansasii]|uniref:Probable cytosol aminopeptidase n=1 Tax=Mycobacterium kansasii TaxID=1768 RepID=A0A1V3WZ80_MYCKA|nr:cytosol aminopeptidase family, catalytic domain protein [Mycobacterium kansasii]